MRTDKAYVLFNSRTGKWIKDYEHSIHHSIDLKWTRRFDEAYMFGSLSGLQSIVDGYNLKNTGCFIQEAKCTWIVTSQTPV